VAIRWFVSRGHHRFTLDPAADNARAIRSYSAIGFQPVNMVVGFRLDGMYQQFDGSNGGPSNRVLSLTGNAVLGPSVGPYVIGGLGLYGTTPERGNSDNDVGFNVGVGYRFELTGFSAFLEARYHYIKESVTFVPLTFGVTF